MHKMYHNFFCCICCFSLTVWISVTSFYYAYLTIYLQRLVTSMMMCSCICSQRRGQRTPSAVHQTALAFRHWSSWQGWLDKVQEGQAKLGESWKVSSSLERIKGHCWPYRHNSWLSSQHYYLIDLTHFEVARSQLLSLFAQLFQPCLGQFVRLRHLLPWIIDLDPGHCDCIPWSRWWFYFSCWKAFAKSSSSHMLASKEWTASLASPAASDRVLQRSCWRSQSSPSSMQDASASQLFLGICHATRSSQSNQLVLLLFLSLLETPFSAVYLGFENTKLPLNLPQCHN